MYVCMCVFMYVHVCMQCFHMYIIHVQYMYVLVYMYVHVHVCETYRVVWILFRFEIHLITSDKDTSFNATQKIIQISYLVFCHEIKEMIYID